MYIIVKTHFLGGVITVKLNYFNRIVGGTQATDYSESLVSMNCTALSDRRLDNNRAVLVDNTHYHDVLEAH
jgi:hypothetical protein